MFVSFNEVSFTKLNVYILNFKVRLNLDSFILINESEWTFIKLNIGLLVNNLDHLRSY